MAYKYREDLVGKRFISVSGVNKINVNNVSEWGWKAGVIRAASVKDNNNKDLQVLVEYDGLDWQRRDWVAVYSRRTFRVFLVEKTLVWGPRQHEGQNVKWPALTFTPLVSDTSLPGDAQPLEFLHDRKLDFVDYSLLQPFQEWDVQLSGATLGAEAELLATLSSEAALWKSSQDGQRILTTTPSVLGGCRAQVYRAAGATQWYTAVIVGFNEHTGELTVTDDTVLEEHSEDPALIQMTLLGDGVVESIMRGEVVGVMPRRSRSNLQRVERESAKSPASTGNRKKTVAVKSNGQLAPLDPPTDSRTDSANEIETIESNQKDRGGDVPEERCSVAAVSADARRGAVASEEDDCVIVCARDAEPGVRGMAHGYGGGPPPPLLHLPAQASAIYTDLLWKQRAYAPPVHSQLHHALPEDYLAAASYDRERHERLLRERRDQEQRELEKQQQQQQQQQQKQEKERVEREKLDREERERREEKERQDSASKLVSRHFEESLRLASQKQRAMPWSMMSPLAARGAEHDRARLYYPPAAAPARPAAPHPPHARLAPAQDKPDKFYPYPAYRPHKDPRLPAPPPLVPEPGSVIVKHEVKRPEMYPRPAYRPALSPLAEKQRPPRGYAPPAPPRSPAFYARPGPGPAYGKPSPAHYAATASPPPPARPAPVPYPPPSAYSPQPRARPPPAAHRTPEPRAPPCPEPCQTQPLDLGVASRVGDDPDRLSPRRRFPFDPASDPESKRRRLAARSPPPARPGSEPPPPPPASPAAARSPPAAPPAAAPAPAATPPAPPAATSPAPREPVRHLGKKAWLQRHETAPAADGDRSDGGGVCVTLPMAVCPAAPEDPPPAPPPVVTPPMEPESAPTPPPKPKTTPKPKKPKENGTVEEEDSSSSERDSATLKRKPPKAKRKKGKTKVVEEVVKKKKASAESGSESDKESDDKDSDSGGSNSTGGRGARGARGRRGARGARGRRRGHDDKGARGQRQPSGDSFLQNGPCFEVAPRLAKCRECRWSPAQRDKDMPNIFCRFYAFRRLKYAKNRQLAIAGFCDPHRDADLEDKKLWISSTADAAELDIEMSCFLLREIGDQFCQLLQEEKEAESLHLNEDKTVAWKRVVQGVREMCDVCETTLFNYHWTCAKCGFVVCLDCYKSRTAGNNSNSNSSNADLSSNNTDNNEERDAHGWLTCTVGGAHGPRRLLLTQIAAGGALAGVAARAHRARADWGLPACACRVSTQPDTSRRAKAAKLLRRATAQNIKEEDIKKEENGPTNGTSPVKSENGKTSLPWLTDKLSPKKEKDSDSSSSESEEGGVGGEFSTLRELLLSEGEAVPRSRARRSEAAVLADVLASVGAAPAERYARGEPLRYMTCTESRALYPAPHAWLCDGRLLHLTDPATRDNLAPFQNQWKRGQPVLVSDLTSVLDKSLWSPASFSRDFGDLRVDLVNCASGCVVPNMPARKFWDGFDKFAKRLRDDNDAPMTLKLKDWPPGEDFAELMPTRFEQLMKALPLSEYTSRAGKLNLASRLPDCFVRPDLGPKMYTAYGGASGTTNLHVDVSDAVNVLVHASAPSDAPDRGKDAERAADAANLDVLTQRRARGRPPAALWHVYEARDADKIRDFLLGIQTERGVRPRDSHDPVHDQTWYLDAGLRERLYADYGVEGYAILQCPGDALFVPAGAPHQVRNLLDCVKVAEDFVSPEHVSRCFELAQQFRKLSRRHANREDKLQIKNIVYHAVKDSLCCLEAALDADDKTN